MKLLTTKDLAERWGITVEGVRMRKYRGQLPPPDRIIGIQPVWDEETIEAMEAKGELGTATT